MNTDEKIRADLNMLPVLEFVNMQRAKGRRYLAQSDEQEAVNFRTFWSEQYERATVLLDDEGRGRAVHEIARLLKEITFSINAMVTHPDVSYYPYTEVHVIDWYLNPTHVSFAELKRKALLGIVYLLHDLSRFESDSILSWETRHPEGFVRDVVTKRVKEIRESVAACRELFRFVNLGWPSPLTQHVAKETLEEYVTEPTRLSALVHLTCFPRSCWHDEVAFLRTIHIAELCFFALRVTVIEIIENLRRQFVERATQCLKEGAAIGTMLQRTFVVLNTMPVEHFAKGFREYTEHASAVQSRGYQLLDIHLRGVDARKEEVFEKNPSLADLTLFKSEEFLSLKTILEQASITRSPYWPLIRKGAEELDQSLMSWRGLHVGFAKKYLKDIARPTGGTDGEDYLKLFLRAGLFAETAVKTDQLRTLSTDPDWLELVSFVPSGIEIAPPPDHRQLAPEVANRPIPENP
jgi:tryptophan 2,3-dioxygenase